MFLYMAEPLRNIRATFGCFLHPGTTDIFQKTGDSGPLSLDLEVIDLVVSSLPVLVDLCATLCEALLKVPTAKSVYGFVSTSTCILHSSNVAAAPGKVGGVTIHLRAYNVSSTVHDV